jgi:molecular chaperone GrpE (heat shock protein)
MNSSNRSSSTAVILSEFLPVHDKLNELKVKYADDDFGSKYSGISLGPSFSAMGAKEYAAEVGAAIDTDRMSVVEREHSTEFAKDTVIRPVSMGMDLEGNTLRMAECVASLGAEGKETADAEETKEEA